MNKYQKEFISTDGQAFQADVYSVLEAFGVTCPAVQHAVKKLLMPGQRGSKSEIQDLDEALVSVSRAIDMVRARLPKGGTLAGEPKPKPEPEPEPKPDAEHCLYIWREFAPDYKHGLAVAIASSEAEARRLVVKHLGLRPDDWGPLTTCTLDETATAWAVTGGQ